MAHARLDIEDLFLNNEAGYQKIFYIHSLLDLRSGLFSGVSLQEVKDEIEARSRNDPDVFHRVDKSGFTPLHYAAYMLDLGVIRLLLSIFKVATILPEGVTNPLFRRDNVLGRTPVELCEDAAQCERQDDESLPGFRAASGRGAECISELHKAMGPSSKAAGCSCGQCLGGFISPRMKKGLLGMTFRSLILFQRRIIKLTSV